jgi:hypothetical protein
MVAVGRQGIGRSSLAVGAPICLLALGVVADRTFHHAPPPVVPPQAPAPPARLPPRSQSIVVPAEPMSAEPPTALDLLHKIRRSCPHPERTDVCSPRTLTAALANDIPAIKAHYRAIEQGALDRLPSGDPVPIHALGFLRSRRALPVLRTMLLDAESDADWKDLEIPYDQQFPRHLLLMQAIENIEGLTIRHAFRLTRAEHRRLSDAAAGCRRENSAQWLLYKLAGTPLPTMSEKSAHRSACHRAARRW